MGTASLALQSQNVIYASKNGVLFDGSDQSGAVQSLCNRGASGPVTIVLDGPTITLKAIQLYSGTTVEGLGWGTVVTQATATAWADAYVFGNKHQISPFNGGTITDGNITIRNLYIDGNSRNTGFPTHGLAPDGSIMSSLRFLGINRLLVDHIYVYDPCGYGVFVANCFDSTLRNIDVFELGTLVGGGIYSGTDVVHVTGPASHLMIENIRGATGDDFIELNACDGNMQNGGASVFGSYTSVYYGSITQVLVRGVYPTQCQDVIRMLSGQPQAGGATTTIDEVIVENVVGHSWECMFNANAFGADAAGALGDIILRDWTITLPTTNTVSSVISGPVGTFTMAGFRLKDLPSGSAPLITTDATVTAGRIALVDFAVREDSSEQSTVAPLVAVGAGTIDELVLNGVNWSRNAATTQAIVSITGGTVNRIELTGVSANNLANVVNVSGGVVGGITSTGLTHRGASGAASIAQSGGTLSQLIAGCSDTLKLASGTIGLKHTDNTEIS